jgi:hypothetical protein
LVAPGGGGVKEGAALRAARAWHRFAGARSRHPRAGGVGGARAGIPQQPARGNAPGSKNRAVMGAAPAKRVSEVMKALVVADRGVGDAAVAAVRRRVELAFPRGQTLVEREERASHGLAGGSVSVVIAARTAGNRGAMAASGEDQQSNAGKQVGKRRHPGRLYLRSTRRPARPGVISPRSSPQGRRIAERRRKAGQKPVSLPEPRSPSGIGASKPRRR